jgi:hypothetical protein
VEKYFNFIFSTFEKGGAKALEVEVEVPPLLKVEPKILHHFFEKW